MCRFVVVSLLRDRHHTPVVKKTVNPAWALPDATFDFPIFLSLADRLGVVEFVVWDKDMLRKEYLGEANIPLEDWFRDGNAFAFDDPDNKVCVSPLRIGCYDGRGFREGVDVRCMLGTS